MPVNVYGGGPSGITQAGGGVANLGGAAGSLVLSTPGGVMGLGSQVIANAPSQAAVYQPGNPYGAQYRPNLRPTVRQTWDGSVLNQTAPYTLYQELGTVVDILDLSGTAVAVGYITVLTPAGFLQDIVELTRTKLGGNTFGSLQLPIPPGLWTFQIITTTASKVLKFSHYGVTN